MANCNNNGIDNVQAEKGVQSKDGSEFNNTPHEFWK